MHMEMLMHGILHATAAGVLGFFVLFAAGKAEGIVKFVGTVLGWWLWIVAVLSIVCIFVCPRDGHWGMHGDWMHSMNDSKQAAPASNAATQAKPEAAPATTPPKKP